VVRLALGKRVPTAGEAGKAVVAHAAAAMAVGGGSSRTLAAVAEFACNRQINRGTGPEGEGESRPSEPVGAGESPPEVGGVQPAPPEQQQAAAQAPSELSEAQSESVNQSAEVATEAQKKKKKNKAARRAARAAREAEGAPPTAGQVGGTGGPGVFGGWATWKKEGAVPGVWVHKEARSGRLSNISGCDAEGEAGLGPREAAVPVLPGEPDGRGVQGNGQVAQLHCGWLRKAAWSPEGRRVFSAGEGHRLPKRADGDGGGRRGPGLDEAAARPAKRPWVRP